MYIIIHYIYIIHSQIHNIWKSYRNIAISKKFCAFDRIGTCNELSMSESVTCWYTLNLNHFQVCRFMLPFSFWLICNEKQKSCQTWDTPPRATALKQTLQPKIDRTLEETGMSTFPISLHAVSLTHTVCCVCLYIHSPKTAN